MFAYGGVQENRGRRQMIHPEVSEVTEDEEAQGFALCTRWWKGSQTGCEGDRERRGRLLTREQGLFLSDRVPAARP